MLNGKRRGIMKNIIIFSEEELKAMLNGKEVKITFGETTTTYMSNDSYRRKLEKERKNARK